jgi:hypothetical protein
MPTLKKLPWVSLTLLLVTYITLGWILSAVNDPLPIWVVVVGAILLLAMALSSPWSQIRDGFAQLVKSDSRAFFVAVVTAFAIVLIITWLYIFGHILVVISASTLVKLDTQTARWSNRQTFWFLAIIPLVGLGLGAVAQTLTQNYLS